MPAAVSLLLLFPRLTIQYKTIYKAMLSILELISSLQEDGASSVPRQRLSVKDLGAAILFLLHFCDCDALTREAACVGGGGVVSAHSSGSTPS